MVGTGRVEQICCVAALSLLSGFGCAAAPYRYGRFQNSGDGDAPRGAVIEYGTPHKTLDRIAWIMGTPARILPLNAKINRHEISPETAEKLTTYLEKNDLADVYVYVNHYDPGGQWRRLQENKRISPGWRYSLGVFSFVGYTLLPNRVFGGDHYNPYTNSLYLNSDVAAVVLHEAAFAKDVHSRNLPGLYVAINDLPVLTLWHQTLAVNDVLGYAQAEDDWELEQQTYLVLYPRMGAESTGLAGQLATTMVAGPVAPLLVGPAFSMGGAAAGHLAGRRMIARREPELHNSTVPSEQSSDDVQQAGFIKDTLPISAPVEATMQRLPMP